MKLLLIGSLQKTLALSRATGGKFCLLGVFETFLRKNKELFKQHTTRLDPRMKLEDAIEVAAEIGDVEILEGYL